MPRPKTDIEERIVEAARKCFLRSGVDGTSLRAIAATARTNLGMVYYYFPTKDDLFLRVIEAPYGRMLDDLEAVLAPGATVETRLRGLYDRVAAASEEEVHTFRLVLREALTSNHRRERIIERFMRGHIPLVLGLVADGRRDGTFDATKHPFEIVAALVSLAVVPQAMLRIVGNRTPMGSPPSGPALAEALVRALLHGVGDASSE
ncbi:MAG: TetR/AcrR family transcriptional regulator [Polyangiales bacterium]|nr:TetR/AcrR family transcriptional regulator [Myxococcales bacterium]